MGSVALPYFEKTAYNQRMVLGSLAAGGALGNLIPPGITFIIYGLMTETSVGKMYIAAIVPSVLVCLLFFAVIFLHGLRRPSKEMPPAATAQERWKSLVDLLPTSLLILIVLGTIYGGLATPTEAGGARCSSRHGLRPARRQAQLQASPRICGGDRPQHVNARPDPVRCVHAELHHDATASAAGDGGNGEHAAAAGLGDHAYHHRVLSVARDVHGGLLHDHHDDPGDISRS